MFRQNWYIIKDFFPFAANKSNTLKPFVLNKSGTLKPSAVNKSGTLKPFVENNSGTLKAFAANKSSYFDFSYIVGVCSFHFICIKL